MLLQKGDMEDKMNFGPLRKLKAISHRTHFVGDGERSIKPLG